ncbi:hypothetical protein LMG28614_00220 [Paraburkholderia ultramafica]|uniref:SLC26A/SulP transporter domain-containing protein n=1 Tax=Paraburkholderia ultramafica TaxID=1544867 RepID=A0A6S7ASI1_9BURK|nr:SulP family inorganic anion transporter [Paraburkholderia ultramafica]CAB3776468.1 hypothetical protein LMG28614_00220 [Paraburkholderia ultramafica]
MRDFLADITARIGVLKGVLPLSRAAAARDALAGVQLASMDIPQVLGYARIAGMPAVTGLYTVFLPLVAFAFFGASRHLVVAADSATATIFASRLSTMAPASSAEYASLAAMVALFTAALLFIARIFKLGFLADFLSRTVLVGFLAGVGVQVGIAMLGDMFGVPGHAARSIDQLMLVVHESARINPPTLAISLLVVVAILACKRFLPRVPMPLIAVVAVVVLLFFSRYLQYLPHCVLAGIVFTIAIGLINLKALFAIRRESPGEFALAVFTAAAVVLIGVEHGILVAVALSLLRHVRHSYRPHTMILVPGDDGVWVPVPAVPGIQTAPGLIVYRFGADLFYANDHFFVDDSRRLIDQAPSGHNHVFIGRCRWRFERKFAQPLARGNSTGNSPSDSRFYSPATRAPAAAPTQSASTSATACRLCRGRCTRPISR